MNSSQLGDVLGAGFLTALAHKLMRTFVDDIADVFVVDVFIA